jgi:hypothetical protein
MAKIIDLNFDGYWREVNKGGIPDEPGIYGVYVCKYNPPEKEGESGTVTLKKLIYIGEAKKVKTRIADHEKWDEWREEVPQGSQICFNFAGVTSPDRERAECALIYYHKPVCNDACKDEFPYEETTVTSKGKHEFIKSPITVQKTTRKN